MVTYQSHNLKIVGSIPISSKTTTIKTIAIYLLFYKIV